jgi:hypothetical protein
VAEVLGLTVEEKTAWARIKKLLATWIKSGALKVMTRKDAKRMDKEFVEVGQLAV